jgi:hypothetical protein
MLNVINRESILLFTKKETDSMPLSADDTKVADELSRIVKMGLEIKKSFEMKITIYGHIDSTKYHRFRISAENILRRGFGANSPYYKSFLQTYEIEFSPKYAEQTVLRRLIEIQIGILLGVLDAPKRGLTKDLYYEREMIVFSDLLDQAYTFLENQKTYLAAGVYGRIVLETAIREFAKLKLRENYNPEMKFDQIIIKLRDGGFILKTLQERLRSYYTIGSDAAHNSDDFKKYSKKDLKDFLTFIKDNVLILN